MRLSTLVLKEDNYLLYFCSGVGVHVKFLLVDSQDVNILTDFIHIGSMKKTARGLFFQDQILQSVFQKRYAFCRFLPLRCEKGNKKE